eukprot:5828099-Amphidinium_carterae.1
MTILPCGKFPSLSKGADGDMTVLSGGSSSSLRYGDAKNGPGGFFGAHVGAAFITAFGPSALRAVVIAPLALTSASPNLLAPS